MKERRKIKIAKQARTRNATENIVKQRKKHQKQLSLKNQKVTTKWLEKYKINKEIIIKNKLKQQKWNNNNTEPREKTQHGRLSKREKYKNNNKRKYQYLK